MVLQTRVKTTLDTDGHMMLPSAFMSRLGLKEKTEIMADYNGKIIIISFAGSADLDTALKAHAKNRLDTALKKIDAKNLKISDLEINKEVMAHRKEKNESRRTV